MPSLEDYRATGTLAVAQNRGRVSNGCDISQPISSDKEYLHDGFQSSNGACFGW